MQMAALALFTEWKGAIRRMRIAVLKLAFFLGGGVNGAHLSKCQNFSANFVQPAEINKFIEK